LLESELQFPRRTHRFRTGSIDPPLASGVGFGGFLLFEPVQLDQSDHEQATRKGISLEEFSNLALEAIETFSQDAAGAAAKASTVCGVRRVTSSPGNPFVEDSAVNRQNSFTQNAWKAREKEVLRNSMRCAW
jgi:hypothetical protein